MAPKKSAKKTTKKSPSTAARYKRELETLRRQVLVAERMRHEAQRGRAPRGQGLDAWLLAAGVAHELNNILGAAGGHAEWALESDRPDDMREALDVVRLACRRSHQITRALQGLSQPVEEKKTLLRVSALLREVERIFRPLCEKQGVDLRIETQEERKNPLRIYGQAERLLEILVNLLRNALDSIGTKAGSYISVEAAMSGKALRLRVSNNGSSVPELFSERIFEPFFTTKGVLAAASGHGKASEATPPVGGSGLGLFLSRNIAREHGGTLRLAKASDPVIFELRLPLAK